MEELNRERTDSSHSEVKAATQFLEEIAQGKKYPSQSKPLKAQGVFPHLEVLVEPLARMVDGVLDPSQHKTGPFALEDHRGMVRKVLELLSANVTDIEEISAALQEGWGLEKGKAEAVARPVLEAYADKMEAMAESLEESANIDFLEEMDGAGDALKTGAAQLRQDAQGIRSSLFPPGLLSVALMAPGLMESLFGPNGVLLEKGLLLSIGMGAMVWGFGKIGNLFGGGNPKGLLERVFSEKASVQEKERARKDLVDLATQNPEKFKQEHLNQLWEAWTRREIWAGEVLKNLMRGPKGKSSFPSVIYAQMELLVTSQDLKVQKAAFELLLKLPDPTATDLLKKGFETALSRSDELRKFQQGSPYRSVSSYELTELEQTIVEMRHAYNLRFLRLPENSEKFTYPTPNSNGAMAAQKIYVYLYPNGLFWHGVGGNSAIIFDALNGGPLVLSKNRKGMIYISYTNPWVDLPLAYFEGFPERSLWSEPTLFAAMPPASAARPLALNFLAQLKSDTKYVLGRHGRYESNENYVEIEDRVVSRRHVEVMVGKVGEVMHLRVMDPFLDQGFRSDFGIKGYGVWIETESGFQKVSPRMYASFSLEKGRKIALGNVRFDPETENFDTREAVVLEVTPDGKLFSHSELVNQVAPRLEPRPRGVSVINNKPEDPKAIAQTLENPFQLLEQLPHGTKVFISQDERGFFSLGQQETPNSFFAIYKNRTATTIEKSFIIEATQKVLREGGMYLTQNGGWGPWNKTELTSVREPLDKKTIKVGNNLFTFRL